jgi:hypothetical protein
LTSSDPRIDPATPSADLDAFIRVINTAFGTRAELTPGPAGAGGWVFRWSARGLWKLTVGAVLDAEPILEGPRGYWRLARCDERHAVLALLMIGAAAGLPAGVTPPPPVLVQQMFGPPPRPAPAPRPAASGSYPVVPPPPWRTEETQTWPPGGAPRPAYREHGANTGRVRPRAGFGSLGDVVPPAGRGPGASYTPRQVVEPEVAGGDLPPRDQGLPYVGDPAPRPPVDGPPYFGPPTSDD